MCVVDFDPPKFLTTRWHRARKPHVCWECDRVIPVGERYARITGLWDLGISSYVHCDLCEELGHAMAGMGCSYLLGELLDHAKQAVHPLGDHASDYPAETGRVIGLVWRIRERQRDEQRSRFETAIGGGQ